MTPRPPAPVSGPSSSPAPAPSSDIPLPSPSGPVQGVTELRAPVGAGMPQPAPSAPEPVAAPQPASIPSVPGTMAWLRQNRLDTFSLEQSLSPTGAGTRTGMPRFEIATASPNEWTEVPAYTQPQQAPDWKAAAPGQPARLGNFSLDMVDPFATADVVGTNTGLAPGAGDPLAAFFGARDVDLLGWDVGSRVMDYAVTLGANFLGLDPKTMAKMFPDRDTESFWRFQRDPAYWPWVGKASEGELVKRAQDLSAQWSAGPMQKPMYDALLEAFHNDSAYTKGETSGDKRLDYLGRITAMNAYEGVLDPGQTAGAGYFGIQPDQYDAEVERFLAIGRDLGYTEKDLPRDLVERFVAEGADSIPDWGGRFSEGAAITIAGFLPVIGTEVAEWVKPTDALTETAWRWSSEKTRSDAFGTAAMATMLSDMTSTVAIGFATAPGAVAAMLGRFGAVGLAAGRTYATAYNAGLTAAKLLMATGITTASANWALSIASPEYYETFGQYVDASRPVSGSALAGIANATGAFATGSWGVVPAWQLGRRGAGAFLDVAAEGNAIFTGSRIGRGIARVRPQTLLGEMEPAFVRYGMGSAGTVGRAFTALGVPEGLQRLAVQRSFLSYAVNATTRSNIAAFNRGIRGEKTGIRALDEIIARGGGIDERVAWVEGQLRHMDFSLAPKAQALVDVWNKGRRAAGFGDIISDEGQLRLKTMRAMSRQIDDTILRAYLDDHAFTFGVTKGDLKRSTVARLQALYKAMPETFAGKVIDEDMLDSMLGRDPEQWRMAAGRAHQVLFDVHNGRLSAAIEMGKKAGIDSEEAERLHLMSQRTLSQQDVPDDILDELRNGDTALADKLRADFDTVGVIEGRQKLDPNALADALEAARPALPVKRQLPPPGSATAQDPINLFHKEIEEEGFFTIGFKPFLDEAEAAPFDWTHMPVQADGTIVMPADIVRKAYTSPADVPGGPWRKVTPGEKFSGKRDFVVTIHDGVYVNALPGEAVTPPTAATPVQQATHAAAQAQGVSPTPTMPGLGLDDADFQNLFGKTRTSALETLQGADEAQNIFARKGNGIVPDGSLWDNGQAVHGNNAGARWPVLTDDAGTEWIFKARRSSTGIVDLAEYRLLADVSATRMADVLGLPGSRTIPWEYNGVRGYIQKKLSGTAVDPDDIRYWLKPEQEQVLQHHLFDWFVGNHDTNAGSYFSLGNGDVATVDKGQAFKWFGHAEEWPPRIDFMPPDKLNDRADDFIRRWTQHGGQPDRLAIEELLTKIEAIDDQMMEEWLRPLADAREKAAMADPQRWDRQMDGSKGAQPVGDDLIEAMKYRRDSLRVWFNNMYMEDLGGIPIQKGSRQMLPVGHHGRLDLGDGSELINDFPVGHVTIKDIVNEHRTGGAFAIDEPPLPNGVKPVNSAGQPEWVLDGSYTKAGVVIMESDGRVWLVEPSDHGNGKWGGYEATVPKGRRAAGETPQQTAVREAWEETGFAVQIKEHLVDWDDGSGQITRYYIGQRIGGGPAFVEQHPLTALGGALGHENQRVALGTIDDMETWSATMVDGSYNAREAKVFAELRKKQGATLAAQSTPPLAQTSPAPNPAQGAVPGPTPPGMKRRYVTYAKMPDGTTFRAPWLDYPLSQAADVNIGNRTLMGAKMDGLFRTWRSWRITQFQKVGLFQRLTIPYAGTTKQQIEGFHEGLMDLARTAHLSPQGYSILAYAPEGMPLLGHEMRDKILDLAEKTFGSHLVDRRTAEVVRVRDMDWQGILAASYRQSLRLNFAAGITSRFYGLPYVGFAGAVIGQAVWPILKFGISPLFKGGEFVESGLYNLMRGAGSMDPATLSMWLDAGVGGTGHRYLTEEAGFDPALNRMGGITTYDSPTRPHGRPGFLAHLLSRQQSGIKAILERKKVTPRPARTTVTHAEIADWITGEYGPDPGLFPHLYPEGLPEQLLDNTVDPSTGEIIVSRDSTKRDAELVKHQTPTWATSDAPGAAYVAAQNLKLIEQVGADNIDRLIAALPLPHAPGSLTWFNTFDPMGDVFQKTKQTSGMMDTKVDGSADHVKLNPFLTDTNRFHQLGRTELELGAANLIYASWGPFNGQYLKGSSGTSGHWIVLRKDRVMSRNWITNTDRIDQPISQLAKDMTLSPAAALTIMRGWVLNRLKQGKTLREAFEDITFSASTPTEHAIMGDIGWEDVESVVFQDQQMADQFIAKLDSIPPDHPNRAKADRIEVKVIGSGREAHWDYAFEKAGLAHRMNEPIVPWTDADLGRLVSSDMLTPDMVQRATAQLGRRLAAESDIRVTGRVSLAGYLDKLSVQLRKDAQDRMAQLMNRTIGYDNMRPDATTIADLRQMEQRVLDIATLRREALDFAAQYRAEGITSKIVAQDIVATSTDPAMVAKAEAYLDEHAAMEARASVLGNRHGGTVSFDSLDREKEMALRGGSMDPIAEREYEVGADSQSPAVEAQRLEFLRDIAAQEGLPVVPPNSTGRRAFAKNLFTNSWFDSQNAGSGMRWIETLVPGDMQREAAAKADALTGTSNGLPTIRAYMRGDADALVNGAGDPGKVELVVVYRHANLGAYPLLPHEMEDMWRKTYLKEHFAVVGDRKNPGRMTGTGSAPNYWSWWDPQQDGIVVTSKQPVDPSAIVMVDGIPTASLPGYGATKVTFASTFDDGGLSYVDLGPGSTGEVMDIRDTIEERPGPDVVVHRLKAARYEGWRANTANRTIMMDDLSQSGADGGAYHATVRDIIGWTRKEGGPWVVNLPPSYGYYGGLEKPETAWARAFMADEIPPDVVFKDDAGRPLTDQDAAQFYGRPASATNPPPVTSLDEVEGTPEWLFSQLQQRMEEALGLPELGPTMEDAAKAARANRKKARLRDLFDTIWNPVPWKEAKMDRLQVDLASRMFEDVLVEVDHPALRLYRDELKVPPGKLMEFKLEEEQLLQRWLNRGSSADLQDLIDHAEKYTGKGGRQARSDVDAFRMSPEYDTFTALWQMTLKASADEAFGVHFFAPYRSTLERSFNHPVFGVYPLSWALKAAKEWGRFLFDNRVLQGSLGLRLGMAPAIAVAEINRRTQTYFAQQGMDLKQFLEMNGPLGSSFLIFGLLMPGDWSSIPFPLSRAIRDAIRGGMDINDTFNAYLQAGVARDLRLGVESMQELQGLAFPDQQQAAQRRTKIPPSVPARYMQ